MSMNTLQNVSCQVVYSDLMGFVCYAIVTLEKWQVKINDSYYVLPRRKEQPFWTYQEICDEAIETSEGTFHIS